jgi:hypothetical protein
MSLLSNGNNPSDLFSFAGSVGRFGANNRDDVIKAQALLANAGYYDLPDPGMPTGWPGGELNRALTRFQKDHGLEPDGTLLPMPPGGVSDAGEGETIQALQNELSDRLQRLVPPSVQEVDRFYRGRRPGEPEPETDVVLRSTDGNSRENIGLKPAAMDPIVTNDVSPSPIDPKAGQQFALMRDPRRDPTLQRNFLPDGTMIPGGGGGRDGGRVVPQEKTPTPLRPAPEKNPRSPAMPGQTAPSEAVPDFDTSRPPDPAQPEEDRQQQDFAKPQRGRIIIAEDGKELHVPPLGAWADELNPERLQIANAINDALAEEMALRPGGSRGNAHTQEGVNAGIQACIDALEAALPEAAIQHIAGGNKRGDAKDDALNEEHLWEFDDDGNPVRKGSNRSDWTLVIARNIATALRGNTYDTQGGDVADRETAAKDGINSKAPDDQMVMVEKHGGARSLADIRRDAYKACYDAGLKIRSDWTKKGEFEQPKPDKPAEYKGPANARHAGQLREIRKPQDKQ